MAIIVKFLYSNAFIIAHSKTSRETSAIIAIIVSAFNNPVVGISEGRNPAVFMSMKTIYS